MSLDPAQQNFIIWQAATFLKNITFFQDAAGTIPQNLTGYSAVMTIEDVVTDATLLTLATSPGTGITLGGTSGLITLRIDVATTTAITWTAAVYELLITSPAGITDPLLYGSIAVRGI